MSAWNDLLTTLIYPAIALSIPALLAVGIAWISKHLGLSAAAAQDSAANSAIQGAVTNFAGKVLGDVADGKLTLAAVKSGAAGRELMDYAASTVGDSLTRLAVTPQTLSTMLVGKVNALVAPALIAAAVPPVPVAAL